MMFRSLPTSFDPARPGPAALIVVGTEWCGFCTQFKPELKAMEPKLRTTRVYWVDGDSDPRVKEWKVSGFPSVLYHASEGGLYSYKGTRSLGGIRRFIASIEK